jgi:hypothetical protein
MRGRMLESNPRQWVLRGGGPISEMSALTQSYRNSRPLFKCYIILVT